VENQNKKIAFLILAHTDPEYLFNLINVLVTHSDIYIHLDLKSNLKSFTSYIHNKNVFFIKKRVRVSWAGISMVDAQMNLFEECLKQKDKYSHAILLSGSDYPIKKIDFISNFFLSKEHTNFIKFIDMRQSPDHYMKQITNKWFKEPLFISNIKIFILLDKCIRFFLNKIKFSNKWPSNIIPFFGSQWVALTMNCCQYVFDFHIKNKYFRRINEFTFSPDEHYIHTIVGNSIYSESSIGLEKFEGRGTFRLANYHLIDKSLNKWFNINDYHLIEESNKLFIRKIRTSDGIELINKINNNLLF